MYESTVLTKCERKEVLNDFRSDDLLYSQLYINKIPLCNDAINIIKDFLYPYDFVEAYQRNLLRCTIHCIHLLQFTHHKNNSYYKQLRSYNLIHYEGQNNWFINEINICLTCGNYMNNVEDRHICMCNVVDEIDEMFQWNMLPYENDRLDNNIQIQMDQQSMIEYQKELEEERIEREEEARISSPEDFYRHY
jgi:hypothetical protein